MGMSLVSFSLAGCSEWLEPESINDTDLNGTVKTEEFYASLREWKQTPDLPQVFVWFDGWTGTAPTGEYSLRGLPDSLTIASNWGGHPKFDLSADRRADMKYVQDVKGTKVVVTLFSQNIGDDLEHRDIYDTAGDSSDPEVVRPAIRAYAEDLYKACLENGYDGYDWDMERGYSGAKEGPLWTNDVQQAIFVEELSYWFGRGAMDSTRDRGDRPMPEKRMLLLIDGAIDRLADACPLYYVDYFVLQAYGVRTDAQLNSRVNGVIGQVQPWIDAGYMTVEDAVKRTIVTENFESYAGTGGGFLNMSNYVYKNESTGVDQQIGGCGIYRVGFDYKQGKGDYNGSPEYYYLRQGITNIYKTFYGRLNGNDDNSESETE